MPSSSDNTITPIGAPRPTRAAAVRGGIVAAVYFGAAVWLLQEDAWRFGEALWPDGLFGLPMAIGRATTWMALAGALGLGLAWPVRDTRRWVWGVTLPLLVAVFALSGLWWAAATVIVLHTIAFDPAWFPPDRESGIEPLFYDGYCGLCHRWVKILLRADADGELFFFSPLQGETITKTLSDTQRENLPDSVVIVTHDRRLLTRSAAVAHILRRLGGWYKLGAFFILILPCPLRDLGYDAVAKTRHRIFAKPNTACPMTPPRQRERFKF